MQFAFSPSDPFRLQQEFVAVDGNTMAGHTNRDGRSEVYSTATGAGVGVFVIMGQSTACNWGDTLYTTSHTNSLCLNIYNGGLYRANDPILGANGTGGSWTGSLADKLIAAGRFNTVIIANIAVGTSRAAEWATNSRLKSRVDVAKARIAARGHTINAFLWQQGEGDAGDGVSQAAHEASLRSVASYARTGNNSPFYVAKCTYSYGWVAPSYVDPGPNAIAIRAAQAAVVDGSLGILAGPDVDTLKGTNRQGGTGAHLTGAGAIACADLWKTVLA